MPVSPDLRAGILPAGDLPELKVTPPENWQPNKWISSTPGITTFERIDPPEKPIQATPPVTNH